MSATLVLLVTLFAAPDIPIPTGGPVKLDGIVGEKEWKNALAVERKLKNGGTFYLKVLRIGPDLALATGADRTYEGETLRLLVTDKHQRIATALVLGTGNPELPPAVWRRAAPALLMRRPPQCPRGCRARVHVGVEGEWSAEFLVSLSSLGIGRGDLREFSGLIALTGKEYQSILSLPPGVKSERYVDPKVYGRITSPDGWGADETWAPSGEEVSKEYDDNDLLHRLFLEYKKLSREQPVDTIVIANAVSPRSMAKIQTLRDELEAGRKRNPTLPGWTYYLGRLLHQANYRDEARKLLDSVPTPLRGLKPFVGLALDHYMDVEDWDRAQKIAEEYPRMTGSKTSYKVKNGRAMSKLEAELRALRAKSLEKKPVVVIQTEKGDIVCELFEDDAPFAVNNFMDLILRAGYYDRMRFHAVVGSMIVQTGDPRTRPGSRGNLDGPTWRVRRDASRRPTLRGTLAMIPGDGAVQHGSQFVIAVGPMFDATQLVVFGRVIRGMDVVDRLEADDRIRSIRVAKDVNGKEIRRNHAYNPHQSRLK